MSADIRTCDRRIATWLAVFTTCVALLISEGAITGSDGRSMYEVTRSLVEHGAISVDSNLGVPGRGGRYYSKYGMGQSLLAIIPYVAARPIARRMAISDQVEQAAVASIMAVVYGLLAAVLYYLGRRLGGSTRMSSLIAMGTIGGTFLLPYSKEFFSEPLTALALVFSIERAVAGQAATAGFGVATAALARPQVLAFAPLLAWRAFADHGAKGIVKVAIPLVAGLGATLAYNASRFGSAFDFGYGGESFSTSLVEGSAGLLFHPSKSLFLFAPASVLLPPALARLRKTHLSAAWLMAGNFVITFLLAASWHSWAGGWAWGPRLLIPGFAPAMTALAPWCSWSHTARRVVLASFLLGAFVSVPATLVSTRAQQLDHPLPDVGPSVIRQYELIAPTGKYSWAHRYEYSAGMNRSYLTLWEIGALRVLGPSGLVPVVIAAAILLFGTLLSWSSVRGTLRKCEGIRVPLPSDG